MHASLKTCLSGERRGCCERPQRRRAAETAEEREVKLRRERDRAPGTKCGRNMLTEKEREDRLRERRQQHCSMSDTSHSSTVPGHHHSLTLAPEVSQLSNHMVHRWFIAHALDRHFVLGLSRILAQARPHNALHVTSTSIVADQLITPRAYMYALAGFCLGSVRLSVTSIFCRA